MRALKTSYSELKDASDYVSFCRSLDSSLQPNNSTIRAHDNSGCFGGGGRNRTGVHGFVGRCMTTLPPRRICRSLKTKKGKRSIDGFFRFPWNWSGKRGSNSRPQPWQGCALPLSYSRKKQMVHYMRLVTKVKAIMPLSLLEGLLF